MRFWKRDAPTAVSIPVSRGFVDHDGLWSTFTFSVGIGASGSQTFNGIVSMSSFQLWLPTPEGCKIVSAYNHPPVDCPSARGVLPYNNAQSLGYAANRSYTAQLQTPPGSSNLQIGQLGLSTRQAFGDIYKASGSIWQDTIRVGATGISNTLIFGVDSLLPLLPTFGIGVGDTTINNSIAASPIKSLSSGQQLPSTSWAFTAGASYNNRFASLVLGGYDRSRINGTVASYKMTNSTLLVSVNSFGLTYNNGSAPTSTTTPSYFSALLDSTTPYLYLPDQVVDWLAQKMHMTENKTTGLFYYDIYGTDPEIALDNKNVDAYTITIDSHDASVSQRPVAPLTLNFGVFSQVVFGSWIWNSTATSFPMHLIRRSTGPYAILGRSFMQEAYVIADFDRQNFSICQTTQTPPAESLIPIYSDDWLAKTGLTNVPPNSLSATAASKPSADSKGLSTGAIAGIAVGCVFAILLLAILWYIRNRRKKSPHGGVIHEKGEKDRTELDTAVQPKEMMSKSVAEMGSTYEGVQLDTPRQAPPPIELEGNTWGNGPRNIVVHRQNGLSVWRSN